MHTTVWKESIWNMLNTVFMITFVSWLGLIFTLTVTITFVTVNPIIFTVIYRYCHVSIFIQSTVNVFIMKKNTLTICSSFHHLSNNITQGARKCRFPNNFNIHHSWRLNPVQRCHINEKGLTIIMVTVPTV